MKNDGKDAERFFEKYWETIGHVERFRDLKDLRGLNGGKTLKDFPKPSDYVVSSPSHPLHFAEVKSTTSGSSFSFGKIQPGQSAAAKKAAARGAKDSYLFYIFCYPLGQWFIMSGQEYVEALDAGKRSVKFSELRTWNK